MQSSHRYRETRHQRAQNDKDVEHESQSVGYGADYETHDDRDDDCQSPVPIFRPPRTSAEVGVLVQHCANRFRERHPCPPCRPLNARQRVPAKCAGSRWRRTTSSTYSSRDGRTSTRPSSSGRGGLLADCPDRLTWWGCPSIRLPSSALPHIAA